MENKTTIHSSLYTRVQRCLAVNRTAGLTFPTIFMGLTGRHIGTDDVTFELEDDATFRDGNGDLSWSALGVLADGALGSAIRMKAGPTVRPATVHLQVQMTGASTGGRVVAQGHFLAFSERNGVRQSFSTAMIRSGETLIGHASAAFVILDLPEGTTQTPRPWVPEGSEPEPFDAITFDAGEREALKACKRAESAASEAHPFIEHFWCGIPKTTEGKAHLSVKVTPHVGNRVGQVHGGLLLSAAASVANAAAGRHMRVSNIAAWYLSPGVGPRLSVRSSVVQQGRNLAVVRTQILAASRKLVLETTSQHVRSRKAPPGS